MRALVAIGLLWMNSLGVVMGAVPGVVEWSDGRKLEGAISLSPGKDIRLFEVKTQASIRLEDVREIALIPEKEQMREGYYFIEAGQAAQAKTGEIYPVRYFKSKVTLRDGTALEGHLYTTVLYVEGADTTEKVVLLAKQTGKVGQKMDSVVYPSVVRFQVADDAAARCRIDLSGANLPEISKLLVVSKPDLTLLDVVPESGGKFVWTVPFGDPKRILFAAIGADGIHVAWPESSDPEAVKAVEASLASTEMRDFYDKRTVIGCVGEGENGDVYSLVLMERADKTHSFEKDKIPWSLAILRWKYDADEKKTTLLNRVMIVTGRAQGDVKTPAVFKDAGLLTRVTVNEKESRP